MLLILVLTFYLLTLCLEFFGSFRFLKYMILVIFTLNDCRMQSQEQIIYTLWFVWSWHYSVLHCNFFGQKITWLNGWGPTALNYGSAKFGVHMCCGNTVIRFFISHVTTWSKDPMNWWVGRHRPNFLLCQVKRQVL